MTPGPRVRGTQKRCVARSSRPAFLHASLVLDEDKDTWRRKKAKERSDGVYGCVEDVLPPGGERVVAGRVGGKVVGSLSATGNTSATHNRCNIRGFAVDTRSGEAMRGPIPTTLCTRVEASNADIEHCCLDATDHIKSWGEKLENEVMEENECRSEQMVLMGSGRCDVGRVDVAYVEKVHAMIECCIEHGLGSEETCVALSRMDVDPQITKIVWQRLENENPGFFLGLNERLNERRRMKTERKPMSRCSSSCSLTAGSPRKIRGVLNQEMRSLTAIR